MQELDSTAFDGSISSGTIFLDFYTSFCSPCKAMMPVLESLAAKRTDLSFFKINAQESPELANRFGIRAVPTFLVLESGEVKGQRGGTMSEAEVEKWIDSCLGK